MTGPPRPRRPARLLRALCLVVSLLACAPHALRSQKALLAAWQDMPLGEAVAYSVGVFGQAYLTGEPQRLMGEFLQRKRS